MTSILDLFRNEPTVVIGAVGGLVDALILVAVQFGLPINGGQKQAIDAVVLAVGAVVTLLVIRSQVTPVAKVAVTPQVVH